MTFDFLARARACCTLPRHLALLACCCISPWHAHADEPATLDPVTVRGEGQPYRTLFVSGAMKTDTPARDLAQSVRVLSAGLLGDAGVTRLDQALDLGSGVSRQSNLGGLWDSYAMRGFTGDPNFGSDFLVNGFNYSRGYNGLRDTANAAAVEVLKGPASALYGRGEPGGTVNITTKRPLFVPERVVEMSAGSHDTYRATADLTGRLSERLAYRLNVAQGQAGSLRNLVESERTLVAPSLLWMPGADTTVSYELEYARQQATFDRGVVAVKGRLGEVPRSAFYGEPGDGPATIEALGHQLFVQHHFNDDWSLQAGLSHRRSSLGGTSTEARFLQADDRTLTRQRRTRDNAALDLSGRVELLGKVQAAGLRHHLLVGVDAYRFVDDREQYRAATSTPIDIHAPVYGAAPSAMTLNTWTRETQRALAFYAQDQIDLGAQWKLLLGLRHDRYDQRLLNRRNDVTTQQTLDAVSPRVGVVYQPGRSVSLYATAARSFRPNSGVSRAFESFPAERGRSIEMGAKYDTADRRLSATLAVYRIAKNHVLTPDPTDPNNFSVAAGEVQSQGLELDVGGELARGLRLSFAYAFTDAIVVQDHNAFLVGRQLANVPRHSGNLLLVRAFTLGGWRATAGFGLTHVGQREGAVAPLSAADDFRLPAYTTVKLLGSWQPAPGWRVALDVANLFDRTTYASSYSQVWVQPGDGRRATLSLRHAF
ncbi:TonB-dependent siderophore receptor [Roseateles sp. DC23W]|uniref:TonB-dependent siderophore receptor n=1 Tax=Pelomonas dachongensis TaxID=3299029 RepID=A0ABW7EHE4_9BURK